MVEPRLVTSGVLADWIGTAAGAGGMIFASTWRDGANGRELIVTRSGDRGKTWSKPSVIATNVLAPFPVIGSNGSGTLGVTYMTSAGKKTIAVFASSTDGGVTWTRQTVAGPFRSGAFGFYQETAGGPNGFASVFIRSGPRHRRPDGRLRGAHHLTLTIEPI